MEYKRTSVAYLWWFLLGPFGGQRFYLGQAGWGLFFVFTFGVLVFGWGIDLFMIPAYVGSYNRRVDFLREEGLESGACELGQGSVEEGCASL